MSQILSENNKHIPLAEIMIMIGFFIIYFIEELVDYYWIRKANKTRKDCLEPMDNKSGCLDTTKAPKTYERYLSFLVCILQLVFCKKNETCCLQLFTNIVIIQQ